MFSVCAEPKELQEDDLYHLCASLNAPVVNIEVLPVGPARAAIVLHAEATGGGSVAPQLSVGLRSLDTGQVVVFQYSGEVRKLNSASRALDVALSFAEAMGFLFDDDLVGGSRGPGRARALALWRKLVGRAETDWDDGGSFSDVVDAGDLDPQAGDSLSQPNAVAEVADTPTCDISAEGGTANQRVSQRRRRREPLPGDADVRPETPAGSSRLGRVPIVRMRVKAEAPQPDPDKNRESWLRLLASF